MIQPIGSLCGPTDSKVMMNAWMYPKKRMILVLDNKARMTRFLDGDGPRQPVCPEPLSPPALASGIAVLVTLHKHVIDKKDKGPLGRPSLGHCPKKTGFQRWLERPDYLSIFENVGSIQLDVGNIMIQRLGLTKSLNTTSMGCLPFPSTLPGTHSHHSTSCLGYPSYTTGSRSKRPRK